MTDGPLRFGTPLRHYRDCDSTNERLRALAAAGAPGGTMVTADHQAAGRGRQGRAWTAPPGTALLCSALLRPLDQRHTLLPLAVPLAVCESVEALAPLSCKVKWPNDVWIDGRKAAGVLIEAHPRDGWAVIGIGLNVGIEPGDFPPELIDRAISIGHGVGVEQAAESLARALGGWVDAAPERVLAEFERRDALRNRRVEWEGGAGVARGVDEAGNLVVELDGGEAVSLGAAEVHLRLD